MTLYSPVAQIPYPSLTDAPNMQTAMATMTSALDSMVVPRYSSVATLTTAVPSPAIGQQAFITGAGAFVYWTGTAWVASAMALISNTTLGTAVASVTLSSIPAIFTHLMLVTSNIRSAAGTNVTDLILAQYNGDTGSNYVSEGVNPGTATAGSLTYSPVASVAGGTSGNLALACGAGNAANAISGSTSFIYNYSSASARKVMSYYGAIGGNASAGTGVATGGSGWASAAAITSIKLILATSAGTGVTNFNVGSQFVLYGMP